MNKDAFGELESFMCACMKDSAHDKEHIYRVLYQALDIAAHESGADLDILVASCLLHDIGRADQFQDPTVCHAEAGGAKAYHFLLGLGWTEARSAHVRDCIIAHRFRTHRRPATLEAKILFDADKLDVTGTIGVARTLVYGGQISEPLYHVGIDGEILTATDTPSSFFQEFNYKLRHIGDGLYTDRARTVSAQRLPAAIAYYNALLREVTTCYSLGKSALRAWMEEDS